MKTTPKISIIVTVYNTEKYLRKCLTSIVSQTFPDLEIICIDDGSTDGSPEMLDEYASKDNRIKVIHQDNHGQVYSDKVGIKNASSVYIGFVDSDDWVEPDMFETLYYCAVKNNADIVKCSYYTEIEGKSKKVSSAIEAGIYDKELLHEKIFPHMLSNGEFYTAGMPLYKWNSLYRKDMIYDLILGEDEHIVHGEDIAVTVPALLDSNVFVLIDDGLYHYVQHNGSSEKAVVSSVEEQKRFSSLISCMKNRIDDRKNIYDIEAEWEEHLIFSMLPFADALYKNFEKLNYLFPFTDVKRGSDIILYCAGTYGQHLYEYLKRSEFCNVIAWADQNAEELKKQGLPVISPDEIGKYDCKTIVVASSFASPRRQIHKYLKEKFTDKTINVIDTELLLSKESKKAFGII